LSGAGFLFSLEDWASGALILENGGRVALPKFAIPGRCWQGYFIDVDNNVFDLFQVDENAN
jgi:uncharacterized protein